MKASNLFRRATLTVVQAALLAGCAASPVPVGVSQWARGSGIRTSATSGDLIYVSGYSDSTGPATFMLSYPQGQLVGSIGMAAAGMCSDGSGNVYLLNDNAAIEYAHGGTTPIKTLRIPGAETYSCSVDPSSNDLAVTFSCPPCGYENLAVFPNGSGTSTRYSAPNADTCSYDDRGNLFLAGYIGSAISELPSGSSTFTNISLSENIGNAGQVQWDGKYVTLQSLGTPGAIYRIQVSGSTGTVVGETKFKRYMRRENYSWISISNGSVIMPFSQHGVEATQLGIWKYPRGGTAVKVIKKIGTGSRGFGAVTVSVAPSLH